MKYHQAAIEIPSPAVTEIEAIARGADIFLVVGVIERDGGTLFCTAVFIDPKSGYVAKHRKLMPTASERLVWGFGDSSTLSVVEGSFSAGDDSVKAKMSACICW